MPQPQVALAAVPLQDAAHDASGTPRGIRIGFVLLAALVVLAAGGKAVLFDTLDPDAFLHLLAADQMLRDGIGPIVDRQSFASIQAPWTPYSWLAEFAMRAVWNAGGYRAAIMSQAAMAASIMVLVALACRAAGRLTGSPNFAGRHLPEIDTAAGEGARDEPSTGRLATVLATAAAAFLSLPYFSFRPVTLGFVLLAITALLLVRDRRLGERSKAVWWVIPLTVLLVNVHLVAVVVPMWLAALAAGAVWERRRSAEPPDWREADRRVRRYALLVAGTTLACLATPMLPGLVKSIVHYQFGDPMVTGPVVAEYQPFYHGTFGKGALALVVLFALCAVANHRQLRAGEIFWLLVGAALLLRMGRFAPVFVIGAAPYIAATLPRLCDRVMARPPILVVTALLLLVGLQRVGASFPQRDEPLAEWVNRHGPGTPGYPCAAADYVDENICPAHGRLINEYTWGGYLEWRLGGSFQALLDGRTNLYTADFWRCTYLSGPEERTAFLARVKADAAVVPVDRSVFREALLELGWTSVYRDDRAEVLIPPAESFSERSNDLATLAGLLFSE